MGTNKMLKAALFYIKKGWNVIPLYGVDKKGFCTCGKGEKCGSPGKHPKMRSWEKWQTERVTPEQAKKWWTENAKSNLGIVTGKISGIVVLDVDGPEGRESLKKETRELPATPISKTGNGFHYIFKHPGDRKLKNFAGKQPGLDFRGDGGYIVGPPSLHHTGNNYEWSVTPQDATPQEIPRWLDDLLTEGKKTAGKHQKVNPESILSGVPEGERDNALFKYACRLRTQGMAKQEAIILVLKAADNCNPPFPEDEALIKIESAWKYPEGGAPEQAAAIVSDLPERIGDVWEAETIGALAVLKKEEPAQYAKIKAELRKKVNLNDLERAVNKQIADNQKLRIVEPDTPPEPLENILPDIPLKELRTPPKWSITENGVWQIIKDDAICACPVPVILTQRLKRVDTGEERVEIAFYRDKKWQKIKADRSTIFNRTSIIQLADKSLPVSSESARDLVRFLQDLERENLNTLPLRKSTTSMGWVGKNFTPGAEGEIVLDLEDGTAVIAEGYREEGSLKNWIENVGKPTRQHPIARFMLAASFAAPLMKIVGQRVFVVHAWGPTRGGKTAALKAALSVWGEPEELIASFNTTYVGLERLAAFYNDLPLGIDEKQVVGDKQGFIEGLVYLLGLGKGKIRGAKGGGLQSFSQWRSLVLSTGEEPISTSSSAGGVKTRTLELYGRPITDEKLASDLHHETGASFGQPGVKFIRNLIECDLDIRAEYLGVQDLLKELYVDNISSHLAAIATVALADSLASRWIFGMDKDEANDQAMALIQSIAAMLETAAELDDALRAYNYFMSWYGVNIEHFRAAPMGARFGFHSSDDTQSTIYIFPSVFEETMQSAGFSPNRILREWAEREWIEIMQDGNKTRYRIRKYFSELGERAYMIGVKKWDDD